VVIGDEAKLQTKLLDDLNVHVDVATDGLREEAKHAEVIRNKGKVCYMYMCCAVEIIILFILIFIMILGK
jgi:hypothetical protein